MYKLAPFHHQYSPPMHQKPLTRKPKPRTSISLSPTTITSVEITTPLSTSQSSPSLMNLPKFRFFDGSSDVKGLETVKAMHVQMIKMCDKWNSDSMAKTLITCYLELGEYRSAAMIFFSGFARNYVIWNHFLEEFESFGGDPGEILNVFRELHSKGVTFDNKVIAIILKICSSVLDLSLGLEVHSILIKRGIELDVYIKRALMNFYGRCCGVERAMQVFRDSADRDELLWDEAVMVNLKNERYNKAIELFRGMQLSLAKVNARTIVKMLQACGKGGHLDVGKQIHGYVLKYGMESNLSICNSLITLYSRNGKLKLANRVFDFMKDRSLSTWNSIISGYSLHGHIDDAWNLLEKMEYSGIGPDIVTWNSLLSGHALHGSYNEVLMLLRRLQAMGFRPNSSSITSVLQAVIELGFLNFGKEIHCYVLRNGLDFDVYVGTSLLDMYVKNGCLTSAQVIFNNMKNKNIFAWNLLISGYSYNGLFDDAKRLSIKMKEEGIKPDLVTWNGLVSGYSMWGCSKEALAVIQDIKSSGLTPNVVTWTALVSGCSQNGNYKESLKFFTQMQQEGVKPNSATISSLLKTCGGLSLLQKGKEIHCLCLKTGFIEDAYILTVLIDMYSKSGDLKGAHKTFRNITNKTLASWNCMIMGFSIYGFGTEASSLFGEMLESGISPDAITFTALLSGCKNSGSVSEGWKFFDSMSKDFGLKPTIEHYSCMVDLLGRAGFLDEAWDFIQSMPIKPDATIWGAFLGSSRIHRNMEFAEIAAKKLFRLEPYNSANYVLMTNLYAMSNRWEDVERMKDLMGVKGVKNGVVWSWIQIDHKVHVFSAGGKPHQDEGEIYFELYQLVTEMKKLGYVPDINCVYQNIDVAAKEKILLSHTEKLAITYGLIKARSNVPIRVIKNTRICPDCHTAAKFITVVRSCEIFLRDGVRFHHFKAGKCSCNDYW